MDAKPKYLLPCAFCGCTKPPVRQGNGIGDYWLECTECGAGTRLREDGAGSEKDWNRRPDNAAAPTYAEFALKALVAAGHVTQSKVDEALEIARTTPGVAASTAPPAAAGLTDEQRTTIQHAADKLRTVWANHTGDKESRELCHKLEAILATSHGDKQS